MTQRFRHPEILAIARREGKVTVEDLATRFGVTLQTIRRDLTDLAEAGKLDRVHGGAVLPSSTTNIAYEERRALNAEAKSAIARACAAQIAEDSCVFLGIGTSTEAVAQALAGRRSLMVVTNNMNVAASLAANPGIRVIVTGGQMRAGDGGLVGPLAVATLRQFRLDAAVLGCSALDPDGEMLDFDLREVEVSQVALDRARRRFVVADRSKLSRHAPVRVAPLSQVDRLFTDAPLPEPLAERCAEWQTAVTLV